MAELYRIGNYAAPTAAVAVAVDTGTTIITMVQVKLGRAILRAKVVEWGINFDGAALATPIVCELVSTQAINATVTAHVAAGVQNLDPLGAAPTDLDPFDFGTAATGFEASAEGSISATRHLDAPQFVLPTNQYIKQWPLGREPAFDGAEFLRIRVHAPAAVDCYCYCDIEV